MNYVLRGGGQNLHIQAQSAADACARAGFGSDLVILYSDDPNAVGVRCGVLAAQASQKATLLPPGPNQSLLGAIVGGVTGFVTGGPGGAIIGALGGAGVGGGGGGSSAGGSNFQPSSQCPPGAIKVGNTCVAPGNALPGGAPLTYPTSGTQVTHGGATGMGPLGLYAAPDVVTEQVRRCPPRMVLAVDGNCYLKAALPKKFRMWKPAPKPPVTASDAKAIRKAASATRRVERLAKKTGLHVYKSARKSCSPRKK